MEVVILCGGKGTRMRDVATDIPKPMVSIGGRPILWHIMKGYAAHGYQRFVLCLGYQSHVIKRFFLDYYSSSCDLTVNLNSPNEVRYHGPSPTENWEVTLAETGEESMTAYRIRQIERYITGDEFMVTYGDGVADVDINKLVQFHRSHGRIGTITAVRPPGRFGELELSGNEVSSFQEKPQIKQGRINGGFMVFNREIFKRLPDDATVPLEAAPLQQLSNDGELMAYEHDGFWQPIDSSREFNLVNQIWSGGDAPWKTWSDRPKLNLYGSVKTSSVKKTA